MNIFRSKILTKILPFFKLCTMFYALVDCNHHAMTALFEYSGSSRVQCDSYILLNGFRSFIHFYNTNSVTDSVNSEIFARDLEPSQNG